MTVFGPEGMCSSQWTICRNLAERLQFPVEDTASSPSKFGGLPYLYYPEVRSHAKGWCLAPQAGRRAHTGKA